MNNDKILEVVICALPYPNQIKNINTTSEQNAIRFEWRGAVYRVSKTLDVGEMEHGCEVGSDITIIMRTLFERSRNSI